MKNKLFKQNVIWTAIYTVNSRYLEYLKPFYIKENSFDIHVVPIFIYILTFYLHFYSLFLKLLISQLEVNFGINFDFKVSRVNCIHSNHDKATAQ